MGEPSCYKMHSPLGGCGGVQSGLAVFTNPVAGYPPHPNCLLLSSLSHSFYPYLEWVFGLPIRPHGFHANPKSGFPKHPGL